MDLWGVMSWYTTVNAKLNSCSVICKQCNLRFKEQMSLMEKSGQCGLQSYRGNCSSIEINLLKARLTSHKAACFSTVSVADVGRKYLGVTGH